VQAGVQLLLFKSILLYHLRALCVLLRQHIRLLHTRLHAAAVDLTFALYSGSCMVVIMRCMLGSLCSQQQGKRGQQQSKHRTAFGKAQMSNNSLACC
jgi:hypothetical protein